MKSRVIERIRKTYNSRAPGQGFHSNAYHRYFEDWSEYEVLEQTGKVRIRRIYTGIWYKQDLEDGHRVLLRLLFSALFVCATVLFIICSTQYMGSNRCWYIAIAQACAVLGLSWMGIALFNYLTAKRCMTVADYRSSSGSLRIGSMIAATSFALVLLLTLLYTVFQSKDIKHYQELLCAAGYLICCAAVFAVNRIEHRIRYLEIQSENEAIEDAVKID
jgi:hypothetical protein